MTRAGRASSRRPVPVLVALANAERPRRARHARRGEPRNPFATLEDARALVAPLGVAAPENRQQLGQLAELAAEVSALAGALAHDAPAPAPAVLNALAAQATGHRRLEIHDGRPVARTEWRSPTPACELARRIIEELAELDPGRLRECARPECHLVFYDTTRSNTQRWHAEDPCGWHQRQARRQAQPRR